MAQAILDAAAAITKSIELHMQVVGDVLDFVSGIAPSKVEQAQPGETYTFAVELSSNVSGFEGAVIPLLLRILGEGTIVLKQQTILITIP